MKTLRILSVATLAVVISACCACRRNASVVPLIDTPWKLAQLGNVSVGGGSADSYTITFHAEGRASGVGDCNRYSGSFTRTAGGKTSGKLSMNEDMIVTRMMCRDADRESAYLKMLREMDSYSIDGARLMLISNGNVLAIFDRMTEPVVSTQPIDEPRVVTPEVID